MTRLGIALLAVAAAALGIAGFFFTATEPLPPWLDRIVYVCFWYFWAPGLVGLAFVVIGWMRRKRSA